MLQHDSPSLEPDFGALPPETNSGRMHAGPGAESMMDAARAWDLLGAQIGEMALNYRAVFAEPDLPSDSVRAASRGVAAYLGWLDGTAARARQTAIQAKAAAAAYGAALAAVVAPHAIDANRLRRIWLAATNWLGQLSPAIADAEADYERMWAQDAAAMYAYARASSVFRQLTPFNSPPQCTHSSEPAVTEPSRSWRLKVAPEVITTGAQVISAVGQAIDALSSSPRTTLDATLSPIAAALSRLSSLSAPSDVALTHLSSLSKAGALHRATAIRSAGTTDAASRVSVASGAAIGVLSVPRAWIRSEPIPARPSPQASPVDRSQ